MKKISKKKRILMIGLILILVGLVIGYFYLDNNGEKYSEDALRIKEEYESLNDTVRESDGSNYNNVDIPLDNPIKYISADEASEIIKNKSGIILMGANWCPWCRNAIEVLIDSAKENNLDTIYYVDMNTVRNVWTVQDGELVKTQEEGEGYYNLLETLDSVLGDDNYIVTDDDGNEYDTGEKRIYMPMVVAVKDGNIIDTHVGTVTLDEGQTKYDKLTDSQYQELKDIYNTFIKSISNSTCSNDKEC